MLVFKGAIVIQSTFQLPSKSLHGLPNGVTCLLQVFDLRERNDLQQAP